MCSIFYRHHNQKTTGAQRAKVTTHTAMANTFFTMLNAQRWAMGAIAQLSYSDPKNAPLPTPKLVRRSTTSLCCTQEKETWQKAEVKSNKRPYIRGQPPPHALTFATTHLHKSFTEKSDTILPALSRTSKWRTSEASTCCHAQGVSVGGMAMLCARPTIPCACIRRPSRRTTP